MFPRQHYLIDYYNSLQLIQDKFLKGHTCKHYTFKKFSDLVKRLITGLRKLGVNKGDRIALIDWDSDVYLHAHYAISMLGAVLHTVYLPIPL